MATRPRRRFPWLALLAVVVLAAIIVFVVARYELLPTKVEIWVQRETAVVEFRHYICNVPCSRRRPEYHNALAARYKELAGKRLVGSEWVLASAFPSWLNRVSPKPSKHVLLLDAILAVDQALIDQNMGWPGKMRPIDTPVQEALVLRFMELCHTDLGAKSLKFYTMATQSRIGELQSAVTAADLIPTDTWLVDPDMWHYFGPDRIH